MSRRHPRNPLLAALVAAATVAQFGCGPSAGMAPDPTAVAAAAGNKGQTPPATGAGPDAKPSTPVGSPNPGATPNPGGQTPGGQPTAPPTATPTPAAGGSGGGNGASYDPLTFSTITGNATIDGVGLVGATVTVENAITDEPARVGNSTRTLRQYGDDTIVLSETPAVTGAGGSFTINVANLGAGQSARIVISDGARTVTRVVNGNDDADSYRLVQLFDDTDVNEVSLILDMMARSVLRLSANLTPEAREEMLATLETKLEALRDDIQTALDGDAGLAADLLAAAEAFRDGGADADPDALLDLVEDVAEAAGVDDDVATIVVDSIQEVVSLQSDADNLNDDDLLTADDIDEALALLPNTGGLSGSLNGSGELVLTNGGETVTVTKDPDTSGSNEDLEILSVAGFSPSVTTLSFDYNSGEARVELTQDAGEADIKHIVARLPIDQVSIGGTGEIREMDVTGSLDHPTLGDRTIAAEEDSGVSDTFTLPEMLGGATLSNPTYSRKLVLNGSVTFATIRIYQNAPNYDYIVLEYSAFTPNGMTSQGHTSSLDFSFLESVEDDATARIYLKSSGDREVIFNKVISTTP